MRHAWALFRASLHPRELLRVVAVLREVEHDRTDASPEAAVARARSRGRACKRREPRARARLKRLIFRVDSALFDGGNCYRRALLESSLDRGASEEKVFFGLDVGKTGHAWLESDPERRRFDVTFAL